MGEDVFDGADQALRAVGDDRQRGPQTPVAQVGEEVVPGVVNSQAAASGPTKTGLPSVVMPQAASTGSADAPSCI
ncbi:hypothetical protein [Streptantibioticus silvisoli]|uniref:Uncharacterized protein n=1 Tax=Streptantibioticus silvisoli TaxID=2705255 RepID=A0ABT6VVJ1_9ACTN|nr:hypothetical protein [Streptantibioticus silvisoli]MDI5962506.1 hypothetical protein [Streptantibioticus silvisoli]